MTLSEAVGALEVVQQERIREELEDADGMEDER